MSKSSLFKHVAMTTLLLGTSSLAFAASDNNSSNDKKKMEAPQFLGDKLPPNYNLNKYLFDVQFLYWQPDADGFDYGTKEQFEFGVNLLPTNLEISDKLSDGDLDFKWDPGFRIGFGKVWGDRDQWDAVLTWTWFTSKAKRTTKGEPSNLTFSDTDGVISLTGNAADAIVPSFGPFLSGGPAQKATAKYRLEYNILDLELGRNYFLGKNVTFRPHFGLRGAWINQRIHVNYQSFLNQFNISTPTLALVQFGPGGQTNTFKGDTEFAAGGLRAGADVYWNFNDNWRIFGKASASILYGAFETKERFESSVILQTGDIIPTVPAGSIPLEISARLKDLVHRTRMNFQTALGFEWHMPFNEDRQHLFISASYEVNEWLQQNQLRDISENSLIFLQTHRRDGNLGIHGVTFDFKVLF